MLKIWGRLSSINVQKVVWCAAELGLEFERIDAGGTFGIVDNPEFHSLNPNRKVPVMEEHGFVLWESNAIVRYLCARHPEGRLMPDSLIGASWALHAVPPGGSERAFGQPDVRAALMARADADRWMDWQATELTPALRDAFMQLIRTAPQDRQQALIDDSIRRTEPMMAILDAALEGRQFIGGDRFTMADIPLACAAHRWYAMPIARAARPNVVDWLERLGNRPAARQVLLLPLG